MSEFVDEAEKAKREWASKIADFRSFLSLLSNRERVGVLEAVTENICFHPYGRGCGMILRSDETCHCENDE
jgi:hypothetical protein